MELKLTENKNILNGYRKRYGDWGCELEALPSTQLRQLLQESIESHIDMERWNFLQEVESGERNLLELVEKQAAQLTTEQLHNLKGVTLQHNV